MSDGKVLTIDFHTHVLPIDHGCDCSDTTIKQLKLAAQADVDVVLATSHFYPHQTDVKNFIEAREYALSRVATKWCDGLPDLIPGAEVLFCENMQEMPDLEKLTAGDSGFLLLEMPFGKWKDRWFDDLFEIRERMDGKVIMAHVDRYDFNDIEVVISNGFSVQLNAACTGFFGVPSKFKKWINEGAVVALGSDLHGTKDGYKNFIKMKKSLGNSFTDVMKRTNEILFGKKFN